MTRRLRTISVAISVAPALDASAPARMTPAMAQAFDGPRALIGRALTPMGRKTRMTRRLRAALVAILAVPIPAMTALVAMDPVAMRTLDGLRVCPLSWQARMTRRLRAVRVKVPVVGAFAAQVPAVARALPFGMGVRS